MASADDLTAPRARDHAVTSSLQVLLDEGQSFAVNKPGDVLKEPKRGVRLDKHSKNVGP